VSMPDNLVLIRHGQSEGNVATDAAKDGDLQYFTDAFTTTPGHQWRLTDLGREQAAAIGEWVTAQFGTFGRYYVSPYVRTMETAGSLALPGAQWLLNRALRERDWGDIGSMTREVFADRYPDSALQKRIDPLYWKAPGGESIAGVAEDRVRNVLSTLHRECSEADVVAVTHGELMWAFRLVLERWDDGEFVRRDDDKAEKIHNCMALHYTRLDPQTGERAGRLGWLRKARPVPAEDGSGWQVQVGEWLELTKPARSNEELLASIETVPSLFGP
jgi:broad specificity phosphatase PhoE